MEYLSKAGERWARRHKIAPEELSANAVISCIGNHYIARERIDARRYHPKPWANEHDLLIRRGTRWLLRHRYKTILYEEHRTGHAKITVFDVSLAETVCTRLYKSEKPLSSVVALPSRCPISAANPRIIRAKNKKLGIELLLRIEWREIA